jgi:hypothetical protein
VTKKTIRFAFAFKKAFTTKLANNMSSPNENDGREKRLIFVGISET